MIPRYTLPEMSLVWSEDNKFRKWLQVEIAASEVLAELGEVPSEAVATIREKADFTVERIEEIEKITRHDVIAFTTAVAEKVGPDSRWVHFGLTSTDVVDTAQALQLREASELIEAGLVELMAILRDQAHRHKDLPMIGRTHGIHAEPITLGLKFAVWYSEMERNLERFRHARKAVEVGKLSGPVGAFSHLGPDIEERVCQKLGIDFAKASTQTLQRDRHAEYICSLAIIGSTYDKIATEVRHLQRTEVREAAEPFGAGQKGSSAMPHKRNPITCEQISGLARLLRSYVVAALEDVPLWHERDISHSSVERVILADGTVLVHYLTRKLSNVLRKLVVNEDQIRANLEMMGGLVFSGTLLLELARKGALREDAYLWLQRNAMRVWDERADFHTLIRQDPDIGKYLSGAEIDRVFDLKHTLRNIDTVFDRVFGQD